MRFRIVSQSSGTAIALGSAYAFRVGVKRVLSVSRRCAESRSPALASELALDRTMRPRSERPAARRGWFWLRGESPFPPPSRRATAGALQCLLPALATAWQALTPDVGSRYPVDEVLVSVDSVRVLEGDTGMAPATFTVRLSAPLDSPHTLTYATESLTAEADSDYLPVTGTLALNTTDLTYTIEVMV